MNAPPLSDDEEDRSDDLRRAIQAGINQADQGRVSPFSESTLEEARRVARERLRAKA